MNEFKILLDVWGRLGLPYNPRQMRRTLVDAKAGLAAEDDLRAALAGDDRIAQAARRRERAAADRVLTARLDRAAVSAALVARLDQAVTLATRREKDRRRKSIHRM